MQIVIGLTIGGSGLGPGGVDGIIWILDTGLWNDNGVWSDVDVWID